MAMTVKPMRVLAPGLALGAAILAGALLAADRTCVPAEAPEQARVRLVSAMAKWRGCLLRVVESRRAEDLDRATQDHGHALLVQGAPVSCQFSGIAVRTPELSPAASVLLPCRPGRAPPAAA
jgi:hypothetical protein